jgi:hypothetical protein
MFALPFTFVVVILLVPGLVHRQVIGSKINVAGGGGILRTEMCSFVPSFVQEARSLWTLLGLCMPEFGRHLWSRIRGNPGGGARTCFITDRGR